MHHPLLSVSNRVFDSCGWSVAWTTFSLLDLLAVQGPPADGSTVGFSSGWGVDAV